MTDQEIETSLDESLPKPIDCDVFYETVKYGDIGGYVALSLSFAPGVDKKGIEDYAKRLSTIFKAQIQGIKGEQR